LYEVVVHSNLSRSEAADILRTFKDVVRRSRGASDLASVADTMHFALDPYVERLVGQVKQRARELITKIDELLKPRKKVS
jgi:hypothetical protein